MSPTLRSRFLVICSASSILFAAVGVVCADITVVQMIHRSAVMGSSDSDDVSDIYISSVGVRNEFLQTSRKINVGNRIEGRESALLIRLDRKIIRVKPDQLSPVEDFPLSRLDDAMEAFIGMKAPTSTGAPSNMPTIKVGDFKKTGSDTTGDFPCERYSATAQTAMQKIVNGDEKSSFMVSEESLCLASGPKIQQWTRAWRTFAEAFNRLSGRKEFMPLVTAALLPLSAYRNPGAQVGAQAVAEKAMELLSDHPEAASVQSVGAVWMSTKLTEADRAKMRSLPKDGVRITGDEISTKVFSTEAKVVGIATSPIPPNLMNLEPAVDASPSLK